MSYVCANPQSYEGEKVGTGECVAFVQEASGAPITSLWKKGECVKGSASLKKGTAIATFKDGKYGNASTGNHAAIYVDQKTDGIIVYDQWRAQGAVRRRIIRFRGGLGSASNDGDQFYVVE
jgi:hypothetical protein